jgi:hypothetical protein
MEFVMIKMEIHGTVSFFVIHADGTKDTWDVKNRVVTSGLNHFASRLLSNTPGFVTHAGVGSDNTATAMTDTALGAQIGGRIVLTEATVSNNIISYVVSIGPGENTGAITEAGLFTAATDGILIARTVFPVINKGDSDTFGFTWQLSLGSEQ